MKVLHRANLTRRVAQESILSVLCGHPVPIIAHNDPLGARLLDLDLNAACSRVEGILDEFFNDRPRTLNNLTRCDLIDRMGIEQNNRATGGGNTHHHWVYLILTVKASRNTPMILETSNHPGTKPESPKRNLNIEKLKIPLSFPLQSANTFTVASCLIMGHDAYKL
jgi:hypothetical protein